MAGESSEGAGKRQPFSVLVAAEVRTIHSLGRRLPIRASSRRLLQVASVVDAGWRFINERRAISLDPNCGWARGKADVLYVADAFEVMARVNALLASL